MRIQYWCLSIVLVVAAGCGDCGDEPPGGNGDTMASTGDVADGSGDTPVVDATDGGDDGGGGTTGGDGGGSGGDGGPDGMAKDVPTDGGGDASISCSQGKTACGGSCVDLQSSQNHCGECGNSCGTDGVCLSGSCQCPRYHKRCGGKCIPTNTDPDNCGSCGNTCTGEEACSAGTCSAECLTGRSKCGNTCVDLGTDDQNCGTCGNTCPSGKGCSNGVCKDAVSVGPAPAKCTGGGPSINVGLKPGTRKTCVGNVAQTVFKWALCSCESIIQMNKFNTDAFDSEIARYQPGGYGASVGSNGKIQVGNLTEIYGSVYATGSGGLRTDKKMEIKQKLYTGGDAYFGLTSTVGEDAYVEGNVVGMGPVTFDETLYQNPGGTAIRKASWNKRVRQQVDPPPACDRCDPARRVPIGSIVQSHDGASNDNSLIGLKKDALVQPGKETVLKLPCGEYYLSEIDTDYKTTIIADGRTVLYVGGDIEATSKFTIKPTVSGELDVFVEGDVEVMNEPKVGSPAYPASTRFYVGGPNGWKMRNQALVGAYVYAIPGGFDAGNNPEIFGGVYAERFTSMNNATIHYDRGVLEAGEYCPPPPTGNPGGDAGMDGGMSPDGGSTDGGGTTGGMDSGSDGGATPDGGGGTTPTCSESGGSCSADGDCCSPLVCNSGTCDAIACVPLSNKCSTNSDCCSDLCADTGDGYSVCIGG